ncbi:unnamed protein product [Acanthoscelides obtectus]|uniref:Uncharacterized protein n=1 Tax=Acanthoscelides obtectus TaxID=200917 RepID=A0A9P0NXI3_ACAOB|nr:unnamed protein product [Acanthoscelides obtectus]CAK1621937.1 hypothetical protein AOBTE_LOCUS1225 [Acanthoscelides obtectus]
MGTDPGGSGNGASTNREGVERADCRGVESRIGDGSIGAVKKERS